MANLTTARCQGVDSAFIARIDSIIRAEELRKQQLVALKKQYERLQIDEEVKPYFGGVESLVGWGFSLWRDRDIRNLSFGNLMPEKRSTTLLHSLPAIAPLATTWTLKAMGIESRSSIQRMALANAFSFALSTGLSLSFSSSYNMIGPDGKGHSMPSQHTALAFASATILSREYGYLSPWISVGAYTVAAATQLLRMRGSQHWSSDIILGAGIGTLSTNLAYTLTNLMLGREAINKIELRNSDLLRMLYFQHSPSNVNMFYGKELGSRTVATQQDDNCATVRISESQLIGVGFDQFVNPYLAFGATASYSSSIVLMQDVNGIGAYNQHYNADHLDIVHTDFMTKASIPIVSDMRIGFNASAGIRYNTSSTFSPIINTENAPSNLISYALPSQFRFEIGGGISIDFFKRNFNVLGFQFQYHRAFTDFLPNRFTVASTMRILY